MHICLRRREFIAGLGGAAAWPLAARAQQADRVRRIGVLMGLDENDPVAKTYVSAFTQALADLGWTDGRNVRMDVRWGRVDIPLRLENPKIGRVDDAEIVGDRITEGGPVFRYLLAQEMQNRSTEVVVSRVAPIVGQMSMHQSP